MHREIEINSEAWQSDKAKPNQQTRYTASQIFTNTAAKTVFLRSREVKNRRE